MNNGPNSKYHVEVVDFDYYQKQIPCQTACPVRTDARGYVNAIVETDYPAGYIRAREPNPLASTCGRVCAAHCEKACRRGKVDSPITIRALKRFLCEPYGVEAKSHIPSARGKGLKIGMGLLPKEAPLNTATIQSYSQLSRDGFGGTARAKPGAPVAVIGAGPAGLTAAHDLAILGYKVTIFESAPYPGGMALLGVPEYRLPRDLLKLEIGEILDLGIELKLNSRLGHDFQLADLRQQGFQAVFLGIGAHKDRSMEIDGAHLDGVIAAVDFLLNINLGYRTKLGDKVVVIGGGDVAVDAARLAARLGEVFDQLVTGNLVTAVDAARHALRLGVRDVHIVYRGAREEMRASAEELEGALEEGIALATGIMPKRVVGNSEGKVIGLETMTTRSVYDDKGKRTLVPVPGSEVIIECSSLIMAVGQQSDLTFIRPEDGIKTTRQNTIVADQETLSTTAPGVFAGGDVVFGPRTIIEAVADGHRAARGINNYLRKGKTAITRRGWMVEVPLSYLPQIQYIKSPRMTPPKISLDRRTGISEVEMVFDRETAYEQAHRCLKCHIQTVFNSDLCILCGGCADICPRNCYRLVPVESLEGNDTLKAVVRGKLETETSQQSGTNNGLGQVTALIKDETQCIRCGLCSRRCPTGAITMEAFWFEEVLTNDE